MKTISPHLPPIFVGHGHGTDGPSMFQWEIEGDLVHIVIEEPFGVNGLDAHLSVGLTDDGTISNDDDDRLVADDILSYSAVSVNSGDEYEMEIETAARLLQEIVMPVILEEFPKPSKSTKKKRK